MESFWSCSQSPTSPVRPSPSVFRFEVDDIHSARAELIDRGVGAVTQIEGGPQSRQYWAYFQDAEGNLFELVQRLT
jgi:predicted enzyme related to lactoylglutathione lyase